MNQFEEFHNYYIQELKDENDFISDEELKDEEKKDNLIKEEEKILIDEEKEEEKEIEIYLSDEEKKEEEEEKEKMKKKLSNYKRLRSLPKQYKTYKLDYKQKIVIEVNKLIYLLLLIIGKIH